MERLRSILRGSIICAQICGSSWNERLQSCKLQLSNPSYRAAIYLCYVRLCIISFIPAPFPWKWGVLTLLLLRCQSFTWATSLTGLLSL
mmetsp:Transcript_74342/g.177126  ORF Transcript_74342/g.177126 Transcript_74342/m.177126 type:complete len:89 (-) Transcript_74342:37-303(-)